MAFELTERWLSEIAGWQVAKSAKSLLSGGAVLKAEFDGRVLRGLVLDGRKRLACGLKIEGKSDVTNLCSCRDARSTGAICAHSTAVGLEFIKQAISRKAEEKEVPRAPSVRTDESDEAGGQLVPVLDLEWVSVLRAGAFTMKFTGASVGRPIDKLTSAADRRIGEALKAARELRVPDKVRMKASEAGNLFAAVAAHPEFRCGDTAVRVATEPGRLRARIGRAGDQQVDLEMITKGECVVFGDHQWWWISGAGDVCGFLMPVRVSLQFSGLLSQQRLTIPESAFVRLVEPFFEAFEESLDSDASLIAACRGIVGVPRVVLKIEGSLRALDGWLRFEYPDGPIVELAGDVSRQFPYLDASGTRVRRNMELENNALGQLREVGF